MASISKCSESGKLVVLASCRRLCSLKSRRYVWGPTITHSVEYEAYRAMDMTSASSLLKLYWAWSSLLHLLRLFRFLLRLRSPVLISL